MTPREQIVAVVAQIKAGETRNCQLTLKSGHPVVLIGKSLNIMGPNIVGTDNRGFSRTISPDNVTGAALV